MNSKGGIAIAFLFGLQVAAFQNLNSCPERLLELSVANRESSGEKSIDDLSSNRRHFFQVIATSCAAGLHASPDWANAAVGSLPEYSTTNAVIQGITVNVADRSQQDAMIDFLVNGFNFKVLRKRIDEPVEDTWLGFGPEQLSIPDDFEVPVSSLASYGGHASIHVRYDSRLTAPLYKVGDSVPGDNIAYVQVGVPGYRISQMVAAGGNILDAYGLVNVVSPSGLPMRGIVGISPDPMMFVAINCDDVKESSLFYENLGFTEQEYPFSRPSKGTTPFEPDKPKNAKYMAPSPNCIGVLLLQKKGRKRIVPNPTIGSLNIVYTPADENSGGDGVMFVADPSGLPVKFQSVSDFSKLEKITR